MEDTPEYEKPDNDIEKFESRSESMPVPVSESITSIMQIAIQKNYAPEFIEKMMDLQERHEANQAKKQYITAISNFKKIPLEILKDKKVSFQTSGGKTTEYDHASLANVVNTISTELGKNGLSASWKTEQGDKGIKVTCILTHSGGHSEEVSLTAAPDTSGVKNQIQAVASTVSYLERYTLLAITGLATKDMDNDGKGAGTMLEYITIDMQTEINDLIKSTKADKAKVLKYLKAESVETVLLSDYGRALVAFKAKGKAEREPGEEG